VRQPFEATLSSTPDSGQAPRILRDGLSKSRHLAKSHHAFYRIYFLISLF
jgi:hypothetical protein